VSHQELPPGWAVATLSELVGAGGAFTDGDWVESKDQDPNGDVRLIQLADVGDDVFLDRSSRFLTRAKAAELRCTFLSQGDVLVARMPDPLGRACIFPGDTKACVTVVDVCIVRSGSAELDQRWLVCTINAPQFRRSVAALQSGSTRKRISRGNLATLRLPIPPVTEQARIALALQQQISRLDDGLRSLRRAKARLPRYRTSVLKAACEGRLVPTEAALARAEGRDYESGSELLDRNAREWSPIPATARKVPKTRGWHGLPGGISRGVELPDLPNGWIWVCLDQLIQSLRNGISTVPRAVSGTKVLRISAVRPLKVDLDDVRYLEQPLGAFAKYRLTEGDLLFTRYNGTIDLVGVAGVAGPGCEDTVYPDKLIRVRIIKGLCIPQFVALAANTGASRRFIASRIRTTAGQAGVSGADLRGVPIPLPPIAEQERIVQDVERRLSITDQISAIINAGVARSARLRQAILKRAFEGKLVPQDPTDEPASLLLERIRKEREAAAQAAPRKPRRRSVRGPRPPRAGGV